MNEAETRAEHIDLLKTAGWAGPIAAREGLKMHGFCRFRIKYDAPELRYEQLKRGLCNLLLLDDGRLRLRAV